MQIIELNNPIHPNNRANPNNINNINNMDISNYFNNNDNEIKTPSSGENLISPINKININSGNYKNSNSSEINTLLALEKVKKTKGPEKIETVKKIDKNANIKYPHKTGL